MTLFGWYSPTADAQHGYHVYSTPNGEEVRVTCVTPTDDPTKTATGWKDNTLVGPVTTPVRKFERNKEPR